MTKPITLEFQVHFKQRGRRKGMQRGEAPPTAVVGPGRVPRVARLMALAIRFENLIQAGEVADYAELARLAHVTRARITQIMNLLMLAPDIQEEILFLPLTNSGRDRILIRDLQPIALVPDWRKQRRLWTVMRPSTVEG